MRGHKVGSAAPVLPPAACSAPASSQWDGCRKGVSLGPDGCLGDVSSWGCLLNCFSFLLLAVTPLFPSRSRAMLALGAFLERQDQELLRGKSDTKAPEERRARKVCWQVQRGSAPVLWGSSACPSWVWGAQERGLPPAGDLRLQELQKTLRIGKS